MYYNNTRISVLYQLKFKIYEAALSIYIGGLMRK